MKYDLVIKDGRVVDGTGSPFFRGDVAINGEKIVKVGRLDNYTAETVIDAKGLIVSPGFIDIHTHTEGIIKNPRADNYVRMGVTTVFAGNCGFSAAPIKKEYLNLLHRNWFPKDIDWTTLSGFYNNLEKQGIGINFASLVGFGSVRITVMGPDAWDRSPTENEMNDMKKLIAQAMEDGAFGFSTGLEYEPQSFAETWEVLELTKVAKEYGGIYATHHRSRDFLTIEAVNEAILIGEKANIPVQCAHFTARFPADGKEKWHVELCEKAREKGIDIAFDIIPIEFDGEGKRWVMGTLLGYLTRGSKYTYKGGKITLDMLKDPEVIEFIRSDLPNRQYGPVIASRRGLFSTWDRMVIIRCDKNPQYNGKDLAEIGRMMEKSPFDAAIELLVAEGEDFPKITVRCAYESQWGANMILLHPLCSIESDAFVVYGDEYGRDALRCYNTFAYFFEKWVREDKLLTLEEAVRKCTGLPAQRMHLMDRGLIRPGMYADIVVFDIDTIKGMTKFETPEPFLNPEYPEGIPYVFVNGKAVVNNGEFTGNLSGKVLRHNKL